MTPTSGQPSLFASTHASAASKLDTARSSCLQRSQFIEDTVEPSFFLPGIISLFIMCVGIIRNNSLVGGRARAESNPGHWARHALLHMAAECVNHSAMKAGSVAVHRKCYWLMLTNCIASILSAILLAIKIYNLWSMLGLLWTVARSVASL